MTVINLCIYVCLLFVRDHLNECTLREDIHLYNKVVNVKTNISECIKIKTKTNLALTAAACGTRSRHAAGKITAKSKGSH